MGISVNQIRKQGLNFKKSLGQNFLVNEHYLNLLKQHLPEGRNVIEVGTGFGSLTTLLLGRSNNVISFEIDKQIHELVNQTIQDPRLKIINADGRNFDQFIDHSKKYYFVSALPYRSYESILLKFLSRMDLFNDFFCITQKEVFDKINARPGRSFYPISAVIQYSCQINKIIDIPGNAFYPTTSVKSTAFTLIPHTQQFDVEAIYNKLKVIFRQRRKILKSGKRAEELSATELVSIATK